MEKLWLLHRASWKYWHCGWFKALGFWYSEAFYLPFWEATNFDEDYLGDENSELLAVPTVVLVPVVDEFLLTA